MPFSDVWSDLIPDDNTDSDLLGADIRQLRLDIHERMIAALVVDWSADPLVVQPLLRGQKNGISIVVPFDSLIGAAPLDGTDGFATLTVGSVVHCPIRVPNGCTISDISYMVSSNTNPVLTASLYRRPYTTAVNPGASVNDTVINCGAIQIANSAIFNHVMDQTYYYWLRFTLAGAPGASAAFYAARIFVNRDSNDHST